MQNGNTLNDVKLVGFVGREPESIYSANGTHIVTFILGTTRKVGNQRIVDWHRLTVFNKVADAVEKYVHKGDQLMITGYLKYSHVGENNTKIAEIIANSVFFMSRNNSDPSKEEKTTETPQVVQDEEINEELIDSLLKDVGV